MLFLCMTFPLKSSPKVHHEANKKELQCRNSLIIRVDQPGLIHGISLSLLAKYLPFVLIVCVAEM